MTEAIVAIIVGIVIGVGMVMLYVTYRIKMITNALDQYIEEALDQVKESVITILVEKENDTYYCYRKEDRQFVCQGKTVAEIKKAFELKYPNKIAVVSRDTEESIVAEFKKELDENSISV